MKEENKICARCREMDRYYTREEKRFRETDFGWCPKRGGIVKKHESCGQFAPRPYRRVRARLLQYCLNELLTEISLIRNVLEAEEREKTEHEEL